MNRLDRSSTPTRLLALFVLLSGIPLVALGWLGWRVLQQDRALELQRSRERLEEGAALVARELERELAAWEDLADRVARGASVMPPEHTAVLVFGPDGVAHRSGVALPYLPRVPSERALPSDVFARAEADEFRLNELARAGEVYRQLAASSTGALRAAALMRLARVLRKQRQPAAALDVYAQLAEMGAVEVAGSPSALVARRERIALMTLTGDHRGAADEASLIATALAKGQFPIDRQTFEFYKEAVRANDGPSENLGLAEAVHGMWPAWQREPDGRAGWYGERPYATVWRKGSVAAAAVVGDFSRLASRASAQAARLQIHTAFQDGTGRPIWGARLDHARTVTKSSRETGLPWTIQVASADPLAAEVVLASRRHLFAASLGLMVLVIVASSYFVVRAVNKELGVARLQSDFVAAVSHEFRTPLTAMCHLTEMLEEGHTAPERLGDYHRALGKESRRLHAMVESLLDFGRIDAGRRSYDLADTDAVVFVGDTVRAFCEERGNDASRVTLLQVRDTQAPLRIRIDRSAVALALRNLLDNAIKYSPAPGAVTVSIEPVGRFVGISVDDEGPGVTREERQQIFRKFARGSAARTLNVKGTGIGLAMAVEIVTAHGGRVKLTSEPGRGCRFTTLLPLHASHT